MDYGEMGGYDSYNDYESAPAAGGGEYGGGGLTESPGGSQPRVPVQTLSPVTIYQLLAAQQNISEDSFRVDRKELQQITFVGLIIKAEESETVLTYLLDDGTGTIAVKYWLEKRSGPPLPWREGLYVRVFGHIRSFADERNVVAFKLVDVPDMNELTYHQLEVLTIHLQSKQERGALPGGAAARPQQQATFAAEPGMVAPSSDIQLHVYNLIKAQTTAEVSNIGISRNDLSNACRQHFSDAVLTSTIEALISGGHVYTSIDDYHYKAAI